MDDLSAVDKLLFSEMPHTGPLCRVKHMLPSRSTPDITRLIHCKNANANFAS